MIKSKSVGFVCWFALIFVLSIFYSKLGSVQCVNPQLQLLNHLMMNYSPAVRPVLDPQDPVIINMSVSVGFIINLDEKEQVSLQKRSTRM